MSRPGAPSPHWYHPSNRRRRSPSALLSHHLACPTVLFFSRFFFSQRLSSMGGLPYIPPSPNAMSILSIVCKWIASAINSGSDDSVNNTRRSLTMDILREDQTRKSSFDPSVAHMQIETQMADLKEAGHRRDNLVRYSWRVSLTPYSRTTAITTSRSR